MSNSKVTSVAYELVQGTAVRQTIGTDDLRHRLRLGDMPTSGARCSHRSGEVKFIDPHPLAKVQETIAIAYGCDPSCVTVSPS